MVVFLATYTDFRVRPWRSISLLDAEDSTLSRQSAFGWRLGSPTSLLPLETFFFRF
jgi:hypothetical protein